jgi:hypothetical protein
MGFSFTVNNAAVNSRCTTTVKLRWQSRLAICGAVLLPTTVGVALLFSKRAPNEIELAVEALSKIQYGDRWSHPQMLKIRSAGTRAVPELRRILREKNSLGTLLMRKAQQNWPKATARFARIDDNHLRERRWVACQALQILGPAARPAAPDLIEILKSNDLSDLNSTTSALYAIGIDGEICKELTTLLERNNLSEHPHSFAIYALAAVKPPSDRSLKAIAKGFIDPSKYVQQASADAAARLGAPNPDIIAGLKLLQTNSSSNALGAIKASTALWKITKDRDSVLRPVFTLLENRLKLPLDPSPKPDESGQVVSYGDQMFMNAGELFREMKLEDPDRALALSLLEKWGERAGRIFIKIRLLPAEFELGLPEEQCMKICRDGLSREEDYYRIDAARVLEKVSARFPVDEVLLNRLLLDSDVNIRIFAAKIHWTKHHDAAIAVPVLADALDRPQHQSYYYEYNLPVAIETLRDIGRAARQAIPALEKASNDPNPKIVTLATAALLKIRQ